MSRPTPLLHLEAPDKKGVVEFPRGIHTVVVELELDLEADKIRIVTKVIEDDASSWKQDEHEVTLEIKEGA